MRASLIVLLLRAQLAVAEPQLPGAKPCLATRPGACTCRSDGSARRPPSPSTIKLLSAVPSGLEAALSTRPELPLQISSFLFVVGLSLTALTPTSYLVKELGGVQGPKLLSAVAAASAAAEIGLSPLVGGLADSAGRKPVLIATLLSAVVVNGLTAASPFIEWNEAPLVVPFMALAKFTNSLVVGLFFLSATAILADNYRHTPKKLAAASGITFALVNLGFGVGVALSGLLPVGLSARYLISSALCLCGLLLAALTVREALPAADRSPFRLSSFNPFTCLRLLSYGRQMRWLVALLALSTAPIFMGDTLQVFALQQWSLSEKQVTSLFTYVALSGVAANVASGPLISAIGLRAFTALATLSNIVFWAGVATSHRAALLCAAIGILGPARTLGTSSMISTEGARIRIPQGQLSGDRSNLMAWLKVIGPLLYGQLYVRGVRARVPQLPFVFNILITIVALFIGPFALAGAT